MRLSVPTNAKPWWELQIWCCWNRQMRNGFWHHRLVEFSPSNIPAWLRQRQAIAESSAVSFPILQSRPLFWRLADSEHECLERPDACIAKGGPAAAENHDCVVKCSEEPRKSGGFTERTGCCRAETTRECCWPSKWGPAKKSCRCEPNTQSKFAKIANVKQPC